MRWPLDAWLSPSAIPKGHAPLSPTRGVRWIGPTTPTKPSLRVAVMTTAGHPEQREEEHA